MRAIDHTPIFNRYKGQWVILDETRSKVLAADNDLKKAISKFRKKFGERPIPSTLKVPSRLIPLVG